MLLNGMLYNSEAWHALKYEEIKLLEKVDEHLLRLLVRGHSKAPIEFFYLEAGATPIRFIISCRRVLYLQTLLHRSENELTRRIYTAQKEEPLHGDFFQLVQEDLQLLGGEMSDIYIQQTSKASFKKEVKKKTKVAAFNYLKSLQAQHSKIKDIQYPCFDTQKYMTSQMFTNREVNLLHALRSRSVNVKCNFSFKYKEDLSCPLGCVASDSQSHILDCTFLNKYLKTREAASSKVRYEDIFGDLLKQKVVTNIFMQLFKIRESLLDNNLRCKTAPSNSDNIELLENNDYLPVGTVHCSSGIQ